MWSLTSSIKVASSDFFFLHDVTAGFFGTDGAAEPVGCVLPESILKLKQKMNDVNVHAGFASKRQP
jgi:hypothetical protein